MCVRVHIRERDRQTEKDREQKHKYYRKIIQSPLEVGLFFCLFFVVVVFCFFFFFGGGGGWGGFFCFGCFFVTVLKKRRDEKGARKGSPNFRQGLDGKICKIKNWNIYQTIVYGMLSVGTVPKRQKGFGYRTDHNGHILPPPPPPPLPPPPSTHTQRSFILHYH